MQQTTKFLQGSIQVIVAENLDKTTGDRERKTESSKLIIHTVKNYPQDIATSTKCDCSPSVGNCPQDIATSTKCDCCPSVENCPKDIATATKCDCCPSVENCPQDIATSTKCDCCPSVGNRHNPDRDKQVESPSRPQKQKVAKMPARRDSPPQGLSTRKCY